MSGERNDDMALMWSFFPGDDAAAEEVVPAGGALAVVPIAGVVSVAIADQGGCTRPPLVAAAIMQSAADVPEDLLHHRPVARAQWRPPEVRRPPCSASNAPP